MIFPEKVPSSYLDVNTRQEPPTEPPLGIGAISVAAGKRKHLLSKINEKKGSDGGESLNLDSKVSDQLELPSGLNLRVTTHQDVGDPPATVTKETGKTRISRKPKDRRLQQIKAGQKKPRNDDLEESFEENSSDRPRGAVDWSATMDMRFIFFIP